ncbi:hypothetical protein NC652_034341 [Populus alba x Populus x berolinensis]|nr:hypothetical protein NC652_034341 [Populus alba x Populus x berolinensis]
MLQGLGVCAVESCMLPDGSSESNCPNTGACVFCQKGLGVVAR